MRAGTSARDDWDRMSTAVGASMAWPMFIDDTPAVTVAYVRAKARRIQRAHGLGLVVIDYLGLMRGTGDNRAQEVGSISRGLKALAKELKVPVIALAQLNRASEAAEQEAHPGRPARLRRDRTGRGHRGHAPPRGHAPHGARVEGLAQMFIRKNRNGPTGECLLALDGPRMRFTDFDGPIPGGANPRNRPAEKALKHDQTDEKGAIRFSGGG
jgi:replicative DNA helicase